MIPEVEHLGDWWLLGEIGSGGQATVHKAVKLSVKQMRDFEQEVRESQAIKREGNRRYLLPCLFWAYEQFANTPTGALKLLHSPERAKNPETAAQRFQREVEVLKDFKHPGVIRVLDVAPDLSWYVMDYHPHGTLLDNLDRFKGHWEESLRALRPIVEAVAQLNEAGNVHRDIKPENIFVTWDGFLVLGDFGLTYLSDDDTPRPTKTSENVGSWQWMPIWAQGMRLDEVPAAFDVFTLGKTLWAMLSGRSFLRAHYFREPEFDLERLFAEESWPLQANELLSKCIVERPEDGIRDASKLLEQVDRLIQADLPGVSPGSLRVLSEDRHTGWTGATDYANQYRLNVNFVSSRMEALCYLWTPADFHAEVLLRGPDDALHKLGEIGESSTTHDSFPHRPNGQPLGHGNYGITTEQDRVVQAAELSALIFDITDWVAEPGIYVVIIKYTEGGNGTWVQRVQLRCSAT